MKSLYLALLVCVIANTSTAQEVPQAVTDQCQADATANELPECLGGGAVGYLLLQRATQADYFGSGAKTVVEICQEQNEDFRGAWTCFELAAEDAIETARLIGRDSISDECVRALANADVAARLERDRDELRSHYQPSARIFGGTSYYPFRGCPPAETDEPETATEAGEGMGFSADECDALSTFEQFLASKNEDELRAILPVLETLPEDERIIGLKDFGLSGDAINVITERMYRPDDNDALGLVMLGAGFLERHHPELLQEVFALRQPNDAMADAFAAGLLGMMTSAAMENYESICTN